MAVNHFRYALMGKTDPGIITGEFWPTGMVLTDLKIVDVVFNTNTVYVPSTPPADGNLSINRVKFRAAAVPIEP